MENIGAIIAAILTFGTGLAGIISTLSTAAKNFSEVKKNSISEEVKNQSDINIEIIKLMEEMKEIFKPNRVQVYDFHNGTVLANGVSLMKCTCTHEVVRIGTKAYFKDLHDIHLGMIPHFINELLKKKELKVNDIEEIKNIMPATYEFKKSQNVGGFYDILLTNKRGEPIGFIGMQYDEPNSINFKEYEVKKLYEYKGLIEEKKEKMKNNINRKGERKWKIKELKK